MEKKDDVYNIILFFFLTLHSEINHELYKIN